MKGTEKKGFLGRLFGRKEEEKKEEAEKAPEQSRKKAGKSPDPAKTESLQAEEPKRREDATEQARAGGTAKPAATSDAVELEMDIPEDEFATVAISSSDLVLEADLKDEPSTADAPQILVDEDQEETDVTSQVVARQYGFPEYTEESAEVPPKKETEEYVIRETMEIEETAPQVAGLRETVRIDRPEAEQALKEAKGALSEVETPEVTPVADVESELVVAGKEEVVAEQPQAPVHTVGIKDVARARGEGSADAFGLEKQAQVLVRFIETCQTPFAVAIQGEEGCGKTSFMNLTASILGESHVIPLWFNAWDYYQLGFGDHLPIMLIRHLTSELERAGGKGGAESNRRVSDTMRLLNAATRVGSEQAPGDGAAEKVGHVSESVPLRDLSETVPRVKITLQEVVSNALETTGKSRVVVFMDDLDRLEPAKALELLQCMNSFLQLNGTVCVAACGLDAVTRSSAKNPGIEQKGIAASYARKIFQLSLNVRATEFDTEGYLRELLYQVGLVTDERTQGKFLALLETSVGFNPRVMKGLVNDLAFLKALQPATTATREDTAEQEIEPDLIRFGILCFQRSYGGVFGHLLANVRDDFAFTNLLEETLRSEQRVLELDSAHSLFDGTSPKPAAAGRLVRFVDVLLGCLDTGTSSKKLSREEKDLIKEGIERAVFTDPSSLPVRGRLAERSAIREFCRRVKSRIARVSPDLAPDSSSEDLRNWPSPAPWFALWYSDGQVKKAWERGHLFFELAFKGPNWNTVTVSFKCNTIKALETGVSGKAIENLKILPILEEEDFEHQDHGNGWVEITKQLHVSGLGTGKEINDDDVENVVEELRDLIEATHGLFDVAVTAKEAPKLIEQKGGSAGPTCKSCGSPLEKVRLKDGSSSYRCRPCGKIYKVKGAPRPAR